MHDLAILVGSLRRNSVNRRLATILAQLGRHRFAPRPVEIGGLPMYNDDLWEDPPADVLEFKKAIAGADAVLFVTPEYNRSLPPVLKNAIDWGTRPKGDNVWAGKPGAVVGASSGRIGTAVAQSHLRYIASIVDIALLGQPEVYVSLRDGMLDEHGQLTDDAVLKQLASFVDRFGDWVSFNKSAQMAGSARFNPPL